MGGVSKESLERLVADVDDVVDEQTRWDGETVVVSQDMMLRVHGALRLLLENFDIVRMARLLAREATAVELSDEPDLTLVELLRRGPDDSGSSFDDARVRWECEYLRGLLSRTDGNVSEASRRSGISREHLHRMMKKHSLSRRRVGG